jgi:alpha-beta hydrolase superfamily lysophospholipase
VRTIDHQAHGRSEARDGLGCFFQFEDLVDEFEQYVTDVVMKEEKVRYIGKERRAS